MIKLSEKAGRIQQSEIRIMSVESERVGGVNLAQGICDTEVPEPVRREAHASIERGQNQYTRLDGIGELRQAIAAKMRRYNRVECDAESEIVVTVGSTGGFYSACLAVLNPGDEVILFEPFYGYHLHTLEIVGAKPVFVTLRAPDWRFAASDLERLITPRTKAIVVNSPANPSGKVFTREELGWVAETAARHDLFVITDEIYEYFLYDGREHVSAASLPGMRERTITISGFSKTFSITGWRVGYAVCAERWAYAIGYFSDLAYICAPSPFQRAVAAGLNELGPGFYQALQAEYAHKRELLCSTLAEVGLTPSVPDGAYYVLADATALPGTTSKQKAMALLAETGVAAVPGASFYHDDAGENLLRFCFAKTGSDLEEACRRLRRL
ncbi:MAG TPA: pyridoxal phosphate-dependent aminotransferase [Terriglobales bacterium]|nr:pyridoxal phosphate-dependent aminotransferase [Terriglobales bacterium]